MIDLQLDKPDYGRQARGSRHLAMLIAAAGLVVLSATPATASSPAASCVGQFAPIDAQNPALHPLGLKVLALFTPNDVRGLVVPLAHSHSDCLTT